jgi:hypothetical protein
MKFVQLLNYIKGVVADSSEYVTVINELDECRKDMGFKDDVHKVFDNMHDIFPYMVSDMTHEKAQKYNILVEDISYRLYRDYEKTNSQSDSETSSEPSLSNTSDECNNHQVQKTVEIPWQLNFLVFMNLSLLALSLSQFSLLWQLKSSSMHCVLI